MSWRDRPYADGGDDWSRSGGGMGGVSFGLPKPTRVVTYLLIINVALFILMALSDGLADTLRYVGVMAVWQYTWKGTPITSGGVVLSPFFFFVLFVFLTLAFPFLAFWPSSPS